MKKKLKIRQVKECLMHYPSITTLEEMGAILNVDIHAISKDDFDNASWLIERNRLRMQVSIKQDLFNKSKNDGRAKEQLYKMICDESELKRWGIKTADQTIINSTPTIEIKSADPDIIDKVKNL